MTDRKPLWIDPDDTPEWTDADFERAEIRIGDKVSRAAAAAPSIMDAAAIDRPIVAGEGGE